MVRALQDFFVPFAAHHKVPAVSADVYERPQSVFAPHHHDRKVENGGGKVISHLSNLGGPAHVLPGAQEDPLPFEVQYGLVCVLVGREGEPVIQIASEVGDPGVCRFALRQGRSPSTLGWGSGWLDLQLHLRGALVATGVYVVRLQAEEQGVEREPERDPDQDVQSFEDDLDG